MKPFDFFEGLVFIVVAVVLAALAYLLLTYPGFQIKAPAPVVSGVAMTQDDLMELKHFIAERDKQSEEDRRKIIEITNKYINLKKCINHAAKWGLPARPCIDARTEPCSRCPRDFDT